MIKVRFENIGTHKVTWEDELKEFSGTELLAALRRSEMITVQPDIDYDLQKRTGHVWSGGRRFLGTFRQIGTEHKPKQCVEK